MKNKMLIEFEITSKELFHVLGLFKQDAINTIPFADSWSAAQVADHLRKSDNGIFEILNGPQCQSKDIPDEYAADLKNTFLDFTTKMEAMEILRPGTENFSKHELIESLKDSRKKMVSDIHSANLADTFSTPAFGNMTRLELMYFVIYHTQRHIRQIKNIYVALPLDSGSTFPY